jgi:hypothetical protein
MTSTRSGGQPSCAARCLRGRTVARSKTPDGCAPDAGRTGAGRRSPDAPGGSAGSWRSWSTLAHASARSSLSTRVAHAPSRSCRTLTGSAPRGGGSGGSVARDCIHGSARRLGARLSSVLPPIVLPVQYVGDGSRELQQSACGQQNLSSPGWAGSSGKSVLGAGAAVPGRVARLVVVAASEAQEEGGRRGRRAPCGGPRRSSCSGAPAPAPATGRAEHVLHVLRHHVGAVERHAQVDQGTAEVVAVDVAPAPPAPSSRRPAPHRSSAAASG